MSSSRYFPSASFVKCAAAIFFWTVLGATASQAQNVFGTISGSDAGPLPGANVVVEGTYVGTSTDLEGRFAIDVDFSEGPRTLVFSFTGYQTERVTVDGPTTDLDVELDPASILGGEVIISASRVEERVLEAPVTVERVNAAQLDRQPQTEIISSLDRLKGVDVSRSSMLISSLSTRGFNSAKSERLVQLIDGFDFISPTLSLYLGNINGVPEIDLESVEIVYGANSALYGANAFNGVVQFQTRDPFEDQGFSAEVRGGENSFYEAQGRWAQQLGERFAYKIVGSYLEADDFISRNYAALTTVPGNYEADGTLRAADDPRGADLVNRYGETSVVTPGTCLQPLPDGGCAVTAGALGLEGDVYTPGFSENALVTGDYTARAARLNAEASLLLTDGIKATAGARYSEGNGIYQSSNRYAFDDIGEQSANFALEGDAWDVRAFFSDADTGDTYDLGFLGSFMNLRDYVDPETGETLPSGDGDPLNYAERYGQVWAAAFAGARQQGQSVEAAYTTAAAAAGDVYPSLGETRFEQARQTTLDNDTPGRSPTFKTDGQNYTLSANYAFDLPAAIDASVGGSYRLTSLNSQGTLYSDGINSPLSCAGGPCTRDTRDVINNYEYGGYLQLRRAFLDDALQLSAIGRFDDFRNFDPRFSPRASAVLSLGERDQHNVRASFSRAFRQPAQLDQYISLDIGQILLLGNVGGGFESYALEGGAPSEELVTIDPLEPEEVNSFEVGYKGLLGGFLDGFFADLSYYRSVYTNFVGSRRFFGRETGATPDLRELSPAVGPEPGDPGYENRTRLLQTWLNSDEAVTTQGVLAGFEYRVARGLVPSFNYTWSHIEEVDDLIVGFNTPEHKLNAGLSGQLGPSFSYGANVRWVDSYFYAMPFAEGTIDSFATLDLQLSYGFPELGVTLLAGGTNLTDSNNVTAYGAAPMQRRVYLGLRYNP